MSKSTPFVVLLACLLGVLFLAVVPSMAAAEAKPLPLNQQQPAIDTWRSALSRLREEHSYFFSDSVSNDLLKEFDDYLNKMRGMGLNIADNEGWNAIQGLRDPEKYYTPEDHTATTRADRHNPFKLPTAADQDYQNRLQRPLFGLKPGDKFQLTPQNDVMGTQSASNGMADGQDDEYMDEYDHFSTPQAPTTTTAASFTTLQSTTPTTVPQHLKPSVQGLESNRGSGVLAVATQPFCRSVLQDSYQVYPQKLIADLDNFTIRFQDLECERHIERDDLVRIIPITASLLSDDTLRYQFAKLGCSWFYRPLSNPTKSPCVSQCTAVRDFIRNLDLSTASPSQLKDRAVLQTIAWPLLLLSGQCEYTNVYNQSNDKEKCISPDDYSVFKTFEEAKLGRPTCAPYPETGGLCSGLLTNAYSDPSNAAVANLVAQATPLIKSLYATAPSERFLGCSRAFAQQICSRYVMSCTEVPVTMLDSEKNVYAVKYALPVLPHRSICQTYSDQCTTFRKALSDMGTNNAVFTAALQLLEPDCATKSPVGATYECNGQQFSSTYDLFPESTYYTMPLGVTKASIRTNNFTYATQYDQSKTLTFTPEINCPPPLVVPTDPDGASAAGMIASYGGCAQPCPSLLFTKSDYDAVTVTVLVITTLSLVFAIFLVGSYIFFKEIRQGNYFLQFLFCLILICSSFAIGIYSRYTPGHSVQETFCVSNTQLATQNENVGCAVEGFVILFAISAISAFFASSGFDLFLRVVLQVEVRPHTQQDYLLNLGYFFWGWTIPLLLTTIAAATQSLGPADLGVFYCFVHGRKNATVPWAVAYLPFMVQLFIGCVSLSTTIYQLVRVAKRQQEEEFERQHRDYNYRSNAAPQIRLGNYIVPLMLEFVFFLYLGWIVLFRAVIYFLEPKWKKNATAWVKCLLADKPIAEYFAAVNGVESTHECGTRPDTMTRPTWFIHQIFLASLGIITFLVLGSQRIYYQLWAAVIGYYFNIPSLLVWAATTQQAKIYGKRLARQRRERAKKLREAGRNEELLREQANAHGKEIVEQIKEQDKLVKEKLRQEQEEKQKKDRERAQQIQQQNLAMIAPHLRPLYMVQQRPRRQLESLVDIAQNPDGNIGPKPTTIPDIFVVFNVQGDGRQYGDYADEYD